MSIEKSLFERVLSQIDSEWLPDYNKKLCDDIKEYLANENNEEELSEDFGYNRSDWWD